MILNFICLKGNAGSEHWVCRARLGSEQGHEPQSLWRAPRSPQRGCVPGTAGNLRNSRGTAQTAGFQVRLALWVFSPGGCPGPARCPGVCTNTSPSRGGTERKLHRCECGKTLVVLGHSGLYSFLTRGSLPAHLASPCQWTVSGSDGVEHGRVGRVLQVPPSVVRNAETPCGGGSREDTVAWIAESHQRTVVPACLGISLLP